MGSYHWGYTSANTGYKYSYPTYNYPKPYNPIDPFEGTLLITLLLAIHEPPSTGARSIYSRRARSTELP